MGSNTIFFQFFDDYYFETTKIENTFLLTDANELSLEAIYL